MKDHEIRELVNQLRDIAIEYHGTQQLRERIARVLRAAMLSPRAETAPLLDSALENSGFRPGGNVNCAAMLKSESKPCKHCDGEGWVVGEMGITRCACGQAGNSPVIPDTWIPVSEQMPPSRHEVLVGRWWGDKPRWCCKWATYIPGHPDAQSSGWLIPGASWTPTHWMPLPVAPQEVSDA